MTRNCFISPCVEISQVRASKATNLKKSLAMNAHIKDNKFFPSLFFFQQIHLTSLTSKIFVKKT